MNLCSAYHQEDKFVLNLVLSLSRGQELMLEEKYLMKQFIFRQIFKPSETGRIYWDLFIEISSKCKFIAYYPGTAFFKRHHEIIQGSP